jgi:hypothetical protein
MRLQVPQLIAVALILGFAGGCGSDTPSSPTPKVVTTQSVVVSLTAPLIVGGTAQASAVATMSDGTTQAITSGFRSDVSAVATVTDAGMVTAVASGAANIYVVSGGQQGTKGIRVVPSYAGSWSGSYYVTGCSQTGDFRTANMCSYFQTNTVMPYNMNLAQSLDVVQGVTYLGSLQFDQASATIDGGGNLPLSATYREDTMTITCAWNLTGQSAGRLNGTVQQTWRDGAASGEMVVSGTIRDSMRSAGAATGADDRVRDGVSRWQRFIKR